MLVNNIKDFIRNSSGRSINYSTFKTIHLEKKLHLMPKTLCILLIDHISFPPIGASLTARWHTLESSNRLSFQRPHWCWNLPPCDATGLVQMSFERHLGESQFFGQQTCSDGPKAKSPVELTKIPKLLHCPSRCLFWSSKFATSCSSHFWWSFIRFSAF